MATDKFITKEQLVEILKDNSLGIKPATDTEEWGTWVDGKTIYKRSLTFTLTSYQNIDNMRRFDFSSYVSGLNIDKVINVEGKYRLSTGVEYHIVNTGYYPENMTANSCFSIYKHSTASSWGGRIDCATSITSVIININLYYTEA